MLQKSVNTSIKHSIRLLEKLDTYESGLQKLQKDFARAASDANCSLNDITPFLINIKMNMDSLIVVNPAIRSQFNSFKLAIKPMLGNIINRKQDPNELDKKAAKEIASIYGATLPSQFQEQPAEKKADSELKRDTSKPITPETTTQPNIQQTSTQSVAKRPPPPPARSRPAVQQPLNVANPASTPAVSETPVQHAAKHRGPPPPARNKPKEPLQQAGTQQPKTNISKPSGVTQPAAKTVGNQNKENVQPLVNVRSRVQEFEKNKPNLTARPLNAQNVQGAASQPKKSNQSTTEPIDPATRWNNMHRDAHDRVVNMNDPNYKEPMVYQKGIQKNVSASGPMTRTEWEALKKTTVDKIKSDNFYKQYVKLESQSSHTLNLKVGNSQIQQTFNV